MLSREYATPEQLKLINEIRERKKESAQKAAEEQSKIDLRELNEAIALIYDRDESFHLNAFGQKIQEFLKANQDDQAFQEIRSPFVFNLQNAYPEYSSYAFFANYKRRSIESFFKNLFQYSKDVHQIVKDANDLKKLQETPDSNKEDVESKRDALIATYNSIKLQALHLRKQLDCLFDKGHPQNSTLKKRGAGLVLLGIGLFIATTAFAIAGFILLPPVGLMILYITSLIGMSVGIKLYDRGDQEKKPHPAHSTTKAVLDLYNEKITSVGKDLLNESSSPDISPRK